MSSTSVRYMREKGQIELALQMIAFEARTHTIRGCTGLSDDRIRRLYATYFKDAKGVTVRRQRGKSPKCTDFFMRNLECQRQAATMASLLLNFNLISEQAWPVSPSTDIGIAFGMRFCRAFALYLAICPEALFCFERAWSLCEALQDTSELAIRKCLQCKGIFVHDVLSIRKPVCACCLIKQRALVPATA